MKFGPIFTSHAAGAILAHSMDAQRPDGTSYRIRKGRVLASEDIAGLIKAGHPRIIAAVLEADDVHEDVAATRLALALVPDAAHAGLLLTKAATGRVNVFAKAPGVARIDVTRINAFNRIDPMITVATVPALHRMGAGDMVATIKIIAYAVPDGAVRQAEAIGAALVLAEPVHATATLIETTFAPDQKLPDKGRRATAGRLQRLGLGLTPRVIVRHDEQAIEAALRAAEGDIALILTASATSDPLDVAPAAVRRAGGTVTRFGMPVDPGNLLFLGEVGGTPVIGLPGCARSPVINGADWVLERVICGVPVTDADIAEMGVGGLLKESPARLHPRDG